MVGIISGSGLGLFDTSLDRLGSAQGQQPATLGQAKGSAYVNIATGNLTLQFEDEMLSGTGADLLALRTYNSTGALTDGDGDGWRWVGEKKVALSGTLNAAGSKVTRTLGDGSETVFNWNGSVYLSTAGSGAHDTIVKSGTEWIYKEDASDSAIERYDATSGWIKSVRDSSGNGFDYTFTSNKLTKVKDVSSGQTLEFVYGTNGKLSRVDTRTTATGALTKQVYYVYDTSASPRLTKVTTDLTPADGIITDGKTYVTNYTYDGTSRRIKSITQSDSSSANFTSVSFTYDSSTRVASVTDQTGTTKFAYTSSTKTTVTNGNGEAWVYTYNAKKELTKYQAPAVAGVVQSASYLYDASGNIQTFTDGRGNVVTYSYDANGNRTREVDSLGNTIARTYSSQNLLLSETRYSVASATAPSGSQITRYVYDATNRLRYVISAEGRVSETRYQSNGLVAKSIQYAGGFYTAAGVTEANLNAWAAGQDKTKTQLLEFQYDYRGNLNRKSNYGVVSSAGVGQEFSADIRTYTYSEQGQLLNEIALRGHEHLQSFSQVSYVYDGLGRQITMVKKDATTTTVYSGVTITTNNDRTGLTTITTTDNLGRLTSVSQSGDGGSRVTNYVYNTAGQLRMIQAPTGERSYLFYDAAGRVNAKVDSAGAAVVYTHDADGRVLTEIQYATPIATATRNTWVSAATVPASLTVTANATLDRKTTYTYDAAGRLLTTTQDSAATITNTYDGASRLVQTQQGDRTTQYTYDKDGRLATTLNALNQLTVNTYDSVGRLIQSTRYTGAAATGESLSSYYFYDSQGRQVGFVNEQGFLTDTTYAAYQNENTVTQYFVPVSVSASDTISSLRSRASSSSRTFIRTSYDYWDRKYEVSNNGVITSYTYDSANRLIREAQAANSTEERSTRYRFNSFGEVKGMVSGVGAATLASNASSSSITTAINDYGTIYDINSAGRKITEYGPQGQTKFLFYNASGQLTYTMNALGEVSKTTYNAFGQVSEIRVYANRITGTNLSTIRSGGSESIITGKLVTSNTDSVISTQYNKLGLVSSQTDAEGFITSNTYTSFGQVNDTTRTIQSGVTTKMGYVYDHLGRVLDSTNDVGGLAAKTSVTYDGFGRIKYNIDANRKTTETIYENQGRSITVRDPLTRTSKVEIDAYGRTLKSYDGFNRATIYTYNDTTRTYTVESPEGITITTVKNLTGETLSVKDGRNNTTTYTYTKDGQLDKVTDQSGLVISDNDYDNSGRLYESKDANNTVTRYSYDAANRVIQKVVDPDGALNLRTTYQFDGQGRQVQVTEGFGQPEAQVTKYVYDLNGQIKQIIIDPKSRLDVSGNLITVAAGLDLSTTFNYDGLGQTTWVSKGTVANPSQQTTLYIFDKLGRKVSEVLDYVYGGSPFVTQYKYDANGNLTRVIDANNSSTWFVYDNTNQKTHQIDALGGITLYEYDKNGRLHHTRQYATSISTASFGDVVTSVNLPAVNAADRRSYSVYDKDGRVIYNINAKSANEWTVSRNYYDANGNVTGLWVYANTLTEANINSLTAGTSTEGALIDATEVGTYLSGPVRITSYEYDIHNRQTLTTLPGWYDPVTGLVEESFAAGRFQRTIEVFYDAVGNAITNKIRTGINTYILQHKIYDKANRENFDVDGLGYVTVKSYDALGNLTAVTRHENVGVSGPKRTISYIYDKANRQTTVTQPNGGQTVFTYNAMGDVIKQTQDLSTGVKANTYFYYDALGRQVLTVDPENYGTKTDYDLLGNVERVTEYATKIYSTVTETTPPVFTASNKDRITENTYDNLGQVIEVRRALFDNTNSLVRVASTEYNTFGEVKASRDAQNNLTSMEYDRLGEVTKITEPSRVVAGTGTDGFKNMVTSATPITTITYDAFGQRLTEVRQASTGTGLTQTITHFYDHAGNEVRTHDALNNVVISKFDVSGKVISESRPVVVNTTGSSDTDYSYILERKYEYDAAGRQISSVDIYDDKQSGQVNIYNGYGEVTEERKVWGLASASVASLMANNNSNVIVNSYYYNSVGQMDYKHTQEGYTYFFYDLANRVTRTEQRLSTSANATTDRITINTYDKLGRITGQDLPRFSVASTFGSLSTTLATPGNIYYYDRWGNVTLKHGSTEPLTHYEYNQDNQVTSERTGAFNRLDYDGVYRSTSTNRQMTYDSLGNLTQETKVASNYGGGAINAVYTNNYYNNASQLTHVVAGYGSSAQTTMSYAYDIHGNKVASSDALGHVTKYRYDANNQLTQKTLLRNGETVYTGTQTSSPTEVTLASYKYDQAGRRYAEGDALGNYQFYKYDQRNNITLEKSRAGGLTLFDYDELGNKTKEQIRFWSSIYQDVVNHTWFYKDANNDFVDYQSGLIQRHQIANDTNLIYVYEYDTRGQVKAERRNAANAVIYDYWENGLQKKITESNTVGWVTTNNTSEFFYDYRGNRTAERLDVTTETEAHTAEEYDSENEYYTYEVSDSITSSGNIITFYAYDSRNRLTQVKSPSVTSNVSGVSHTTTNLTLLQYDYDEWGNRRRIQGTYGPNTSTPSKVEWYSYDALGRVLIEAGSSDGSRAYVKIGSQAKEYGYDAAGRRVKELIGFTIGENKTIEEGFIHDWTIYASRSDRLFTYNDMGLVTKTERRDAYSEEVEVKWLTDAQRGQARAQLQNAILTTDGPDVTEVTNDYDTRGFNELSIKSGLATTSKYNEDGTLLSQITKIINNDRKLSRILNSYNTNGELKKYEYTKYDTTRDGNHIDSQTFYHYSYINTYAGRQINNITVNAPQGGTGIGATRNTYDTRGRLIQANITEQHATIQNQTGFSDRRFVYNTSGQIVAKMEQQYGATTPYKVQSYFYSPTGGELANLGELSGHNISPLSPVVSGGSTPGTYSVNAGDTLMGIANSLFGDAKLWYLIADANGLTQGPTDAFGPGDTSRVLKIPNSDKTISNTSSNFKPYNPTEIIGDLTPSPRILPPPKATGCNTIAMIIIIVVAVIVTIYTAGAAAGPASATTSTVGAGAAAGTTGASTFGTGLAALGGGSATVATGVTVSVSAGAAFTGAVVGGFVGSVAGQLAGKALGVTDSFSLRQAVAGGLTAGFGSLAGAFFSGLGTGSKLVNTAGNLNSAGDLARGAVSYLGAYASNKIAGLETSFNWTDLAVASVSSGITGSSGNKITDNVSRIGGDIFGSTVNNFFNSVVSSSLSRLTGRGEKQNWGALAIDAFGNALATKVVEIGSTPKTKSTPSQVVNNSDDNYGFGLDDPFAMDEPAPKTDTATQKVVEKVTEGGGNSGEKALEAKRVVEQQKAKTETSHSSQKGRNSTINLKGGPDSEGLTLMEELDIGGVNTSTRSAYIGAGNQDVETGRFSRSVFSEESLRETRRQSVSVEADAEFRFFEYSDSEVLAEKSFSKIELGDEYFGMSIGVDAKATRSSHAQFSLSYNDGFVASAGLSREASVTYYEGWAKSDLGEMRVGFGSVATAQAESTLSFGYTPSKGFKWDTSANFDAGAAAFKLTVDGKTRDFDLGIFNVSIDARVEGHLVGAGASLKGGIKTLESRPGVRAYLGAGLTAFAGGKFSLGAEASFHPRAIETYNSAVARTTDLFERYLSPSSLTHKKP